MAAVPAVMAADEDAKERLAHRRVARGRRRVGLPQSVSTDECVYIYI